jgi:hypothetical protein
MFYDERHITTRTDESPMTAPPTTATNRFHQPRAFISAEAQAASTASPIEGIPAHDETNPGDGIHTITTAQAPAAPAIRISIEIDRASRDMTAPTETIARGPIGDD